MRLSEIAEALAGRFTEGQTGFPMARLLERVQALAPDLTCYAAW